MKDFHKRIHLRQLSSNKFEVNLNSGNNLKDESKIRKSGQLQKHLQSGKQSFKTTF